MGGIIILLLLLVSLIAFIYFVVVTAKGWGALHVTMLCFLFIECWCFLFFAAGVHSNRVKSLANLDKQEKRAENAAKATKDLLWGTNFQADINNLEAVVVAQNELLRIAGDRGRVWRGVEFITAKADAFDLELTSAPAPTVDELTGEAPAPAAAAAPPSSLSLPVGLIVYAFGEEVEQDTGLRKPKFYFGEQTVTKSQDGAVTLKPTVPLTPLQQQGTRNPAVTSWTLYESLPLDNHRAFSAPGSKETAEQIFGRMDEPTISALFASVPEADNRQANVIASFLHDGQPATDDDPEDAIWLQLSMSKKKEFNVDGSPANIQNGSFHDSLGRAIDARLHIEDTQENKGMVSIGPDIKDELIIFKRSTATDEMINGSEAELMQRIYVRPLIDFEQAFAAHDVRMKDVAERIKKYKRETDRLTQATSDIQNIISSEQLVYGKLEEDLGGYRREVTVLDERAKVSEEAVANLEQELGTLFNLIQSSP